MLVLVSLACGVVLGIVLHPDVPRGVADYLPIALMASLDSVFGGLRARLDGLFDERIFVVSLITNSVLAGLLVWAGERLGVRDILIAVVVVFGVRIFQNLAAIRRKIFHA